MIDVFIHILIPKEALLDKLAVAPGDCGTMSAFHIFTFVPLANIARRRDNDPTAISHGFTRKTAH
jgi:hypothetical protein